jgi:hypothetical protein
VSQFYPRYATENFTISNLQFYYIRNQYLKVYDNVVFTVVLK